MKLSFIPTVAGEEGNYDLWIDGSSTVLNISPKEVLESIQDLREQQNVISQMDLFARAIPKINFLMPDPNIPKGVTQLIFIEGEVPKGFAGKELRVYERITDDDNFIIMALYDVSGIDIEGEILERCDWCFYINRRTKEIGKMIGYCEDTPEGEIRQRILETLILKLGRDIKIKI